MGNKKKRGHPDVEEILARPWCYYCERDFDDLKILINHQKARHFKCERCGRRLNTAGGLSVHMTQVHKETLTTIENALPNRSGLDVEIFGMEGIPEDIVTSHNQRILQQFAQAEADRRAATGNHGPGNAGPGAAKKPKFESPSELKKRLAEHKAKKAAEQAAGISSGDVTPIGGHGSQSPSQAGSPGYSQPQMQFGGPPNNSTYSSYPQPYSQQGTPFQQQPSPFAPPQQSQFPPQQPGFEPPGMHNQAFAPPQQYQGPPGGQGFSPPYQNGPPPFQGGPPQFQNGPPQFQGGVPQFQNGPPHFQNGPPPFQNGPPQPFGPGSPAVPFQHGQFQPPRTHTPPQNGPLPLRSGNLPPAPGLPQRPSFGAPPVNAFQMQQMHQGQLSGPPNPPENRTLTQSPQGAPPTHTEAQSSLSNDVDDLLYGAAKDADKAESIANGKLEAKAEEPQDEKKGKKDKNAKLVYSDNEISPEEKMAQLPRYAFVPSEKDGKLSGEATTSTASVTASA